MKPEEVEEEKKDKNKDATKIVAQEIALIVIEEGLELPPYAIALGVIKASITFFEGLAQFTYSKHEIDLINLIKDLELELSKYYKFCNSLTCNPRTNIHKYYYAIINRTHELIPKEKKIYEYLCKLIDYTKIRVREYKNAKYSIDLKISEAVDKIDLIYIRDVVDTCHKKVVDEYNLYFESNYIKMFERWNSCNFYASDFRRKIFSFSHIYEADKKAAKTYKEDVIPNSLRKSINDNACNVINYFKDVYVDIWQSDWFDDNKLELLKIVVKAMNDIYIKYFLLQDRYDKMYILTNDTYHKMIASYNQFNNKTLKFIKDDWLLNQFDSFRDLINRKDDKNSKERDKQPDSQPHSQMIQNNNGAGKRQLSAVFGSDNQPLTQMTNVSNQDDIVNWAKSLNTSNALGMRDRDDIIHTISKTNERDNQYTAFINTVSDIINKQNTTMAVLA